MATPIDQRRLRDGATALALVAKHPESKAELEKLLLVIYDGMLALQSLDDLGEQGNYFADIDMQILELRYRQLEGLKAVTWLT